MYHRSASTTWSHARHGPNIESTTDRVPVQNGVKSDFAIAPTCFSIFLAAVLHLHWSGVKLQDKWEIAQAASALQYKEHTRFCH